MFLKQLLAILSFIIIVTVILIGGIILKDKNTAATEKSVDIYLYKNNQLLPVKRKIDSQENKLQHALQHLISGPVQKEKNRNFFSLIPAELKIEEVLLDHGIVYIFFSDNVSAVSGGVALIQGFIKQFVYTCTQFDEIAAVIFTTHAAQNKPLIIGGEGYTIDAPLDRNSFN